MTTNQPTPVILSDEQVAEIEAQPSRLINGLEGILLSPAERDALCATVRALRLQLDDTAQLAAKAGANVDRLDKENTALREQLAHRIIELENESREMQKWNNRANQLAVEAQELRQQLGQAEKERDDLQRQLDAEYEAQAGADL